MNEIPRGIEVLVKKASVDPHFKKTLLEKRADAAGEIGLTLEPSEIAMINAVPKAQLEAIIANTTVHPKQRTAFLGRVAAVMIVALGASTAGYGCKQSPSEGVRPERPERIEPTKGIAPERPEVEEEHEQQETSPRKPHMTRGIEPDRP